MATAPTTSASINDMLRTFIAEAQFVQEHKGVMDKIIDTQSLPKKWGRTWNEPYLNALDAVDLVENSVFDSPQQISDATTQITPSEKGCQILWPHRLNDVITENLPTIGGKLIANALEYKRDTDLLTLLDGFGGSLGSGTAAASVGIIDAALTAIREGRAINSGVARTGARATGDPATSPLRVVLQERHRHDLMSQLSGVGTAAGNTTSAIGAMNFAGQMLSEYNRKWIETYYICHVAGAMVVVDNNLTIDGSNQVKAGAFEEEALVQVKFRGIKEKQFETADGRFMQQTVVIDYGYGERKDVGGVELHLDATAAAT